MEIVKPLESTPAQRQPPSGSRFTVGVLVLLAFILGVCFARPITRAAKVVFQFAPALLGGVPAMASFDSSGRELLRLDLDKVPQDVRARVLSALKTELLNAYPPISPNNFSEVEFDASSTTSMTLTLRQRSDQPYKFLVHEIGPPPFESTGAVVRWHCWIGSEPSTSEPGLIQSTDPKFQDLFSLVYSPRVIDRVKEIWKAAETAQSTEPEAQFKLIKVTVAGTLLKYSSPPSVKPPATPQGDSHASDPAH